MCKPTSSFAKYYKTVNSKGNKCDKYKLNHIKRYQDEYRRQQENQRRLALINERIQFILFMKILLHCMKRSTNDDDHHMMLLQQVRLVVITCTNGHKLQDPTFVCENSIIDSITLRLKKIIGETIYWKQAHQYTHYYLSSCKKKKTALSLIRVQQQKSKMSHKEMANMMEKKNLMMKVEKDDDDVNVTTKEIVTTTTTTTTTTMTATATKALPPSLRPPSPPPAAAKYDVPTSAVARKPSLTPSIFSYISDDSSCGSLIDDDEPINIFFDGRQPPQQRQRLQGQMTTTDDDNDRKCPPVESIQFERRSNTNNNI